MVKEDFIKIIIPYCDCDPTGFVHHANLVKYCEQARISIMKANGVTLTQALKYGYKIVTFKVSAIFVKPLSYDDAIIIETEIKHVNTLKIVTTHTMKKEGVISAVIECVTVFLDEDLNAKVLPEGVWNGTWEIGDIGDIV
jgi:acyl-CoA thioester hydrolase